MASRYSRQPSASPRRRRRTESDNVGQLERRASASSTGSAARHGHSHSLDMGTAGMTALSPTYDSGSESDDARKQKSRGRASSILRAGRGLLGRLNSGATRDADGDIFESCDEFPALSRDDDDDSVVSDECMILTDDEDDETDEYPRMASTRSQDNDIVSPRMSLAQAETIALKSMFAEKHPWRRRTSVDATVQNSAVKAPKLPPARFAGDEVDDLVSFPRSKQRDKLSGLVLTQSRSEEEEEDDDSSSASEDDSSSMQSSLSFISDPEEDLDFASLEHIPNHFTSQPQVMSAFLDPSLGSIPEQDCATFAYEHSLLLRAIMQLLAERDYIGVEADLDDLSCIVKKGPLKKAAHAVGRTTWKVKYVEIRPGSFSYFEDSARNKNLGRKTIPLRSNKCSCVSVKGNQFALKVEDGPQRLWMTTSEEERQAWVRAIQEAMIGPGAEDNAKPLDVRPYQAALDQFQATQTKLRQARTEGEYMFSLEKLFQSNIRIPVQWVRDRAVDDFDAQSVRRLVTSAQKRMNTSVTDLWKSLKKETVSINGCEVQASSAHAAERIVGALSRCILEFDKSSPVESRVPMSELQAISYARDVVMAVLRCRNKDEAHLSLEYMCQNPSLVTVLPLATSEPYRTFSVRVNYATPEASEDLKTSDISGWVSTRSRFNRIWKSRFITVSDGILNVFEHSSPRPHGLKDQLLLAGATVKTIEDKPKHEANLYILLIVGRNRETERQISFPDEGLLQEWADAIQKSIDSCPVPNYSDPSSSLTPRKIIPISGAKIFKGATDQFIKATDIIRSIRPSGAEARSRTASMETPESSDYLTRSEPNQSLTLTSSFESELPPTRNEPTVQVMAESTSMFKIVAALESEDEGEDVLV